MPITGEFTWKDKPDSLRVQIPLKGCSPNSVDIFVTKNTLKVNYKPYLVDIVLNGDVNETRHKATVKEGMLHLTLFKLSAGLWTELVRTVDSKAALKEIKNESSKGHFKLQEELRVQRMDRRIEDERVALRKQMKLDETERSTLENLKQEEKEAAEEVVYNKFAEMKRESSEETIRAKQKINRVEREKKEELSTIFTKADMVKVEVEKEFGDIDSDIDDDDDNDANKGDTDNKPESEEGRSDIFDPPEFEGDEVDDSEIKYVPPPRSSGYKADTKIDIEFTPRVFPTPMRESKAAEEEDWIAKNRRALKKHAVFGKNVKKAMPGADISESDPSWLKGKGDDFFRVGDFKSASSAYTSAIDLDDDFFPAYSNRSACYLKMDMYKEGLEDCECAIRLLVMPYLEESIQKLAPMSPEINIAIDAMTFLKKGDRIDMKATTQLEKLRYRRATCECQLGMFANALKDYSGILTSVLQHEANGGETSFNSADIKKNIEKVQLLVDVEARKAEGDKLFSQGQVKEAMVAYSDALEKLPVHVSCLSNRSAAKMSLGDASGCIDDCETALQLLKIDTSNPNVTTSAQLSSVVGGNCINLLGAVIPPTGSAKRLQWVVKTMVRKGTAHAQLKQLDEAVAEYTQAASLDPNNEKLRSDLMKVTNYRLGIEKMAAAK